MARSAFTGGLFPTLQNHVGPLQGVWGHWEALIRIHGVSNCCQRPSWPTMSTVAVSVPYWGHTTALCLLVDGITRLRLSTSPHPLPPTHPLYTLSVILQQLEKNYLKTQQCQLGGRISYKTIATQVVYLYC